MPDQAEPSEDIIGQFESNKLIESRWSNQLLKPIVADSAGKTLMKSNFWLFKIKTPSKQVHIDPTEAFKDIFEQFNVQISHGNSSRLGRRLQFLSIFSETQKRFLYGAVAPAKSPNWRRGDSQMAELVILYLVNIEYIVVHDVFTEKDAKFYSLPHIKK